MEVTEAPSVHRATELVSTLFSNFMPKAFIPKELSRICTLHLRRSLCRRHLRDIAFTSVPSVTPCAYYIRLLVYHSIFQKSHNLFLCHLFCKLFLCSSKAIHALLASKRRPIGLQKVPFKPLTNALLKSN